MTALLASAHRVVVKVGSALVTNDGRGLDDSALARWAGQIAALQKMGKEVILVSSGAVAEGVLRLGWEKRPGRLYELQAAAAVGQMGLVQAYERHFREHGIGTAQVLLTHANLTDREQYLNARMTLIELLRLGVVPVINENDTIATSEIKVGDNDTLGALVTPDTYAVHIEKSRRDVEGGYPYLAHSLAKALPETVKVLNREEDLGVPGLRKAKHDWFPLYQLEKGVYEIAPFEP